MNLYKTIYLFLFLFINFNIFSQCPVNVDFSFQQNCGTSTFQFTDLSTSNTGNITAWQWDFGNGNSSTQQNPVQSFVLGNSYTITLTVTHNTNCTSSIQKNITVSQPPQASFNFNPNNVCSETTIHFSSTSTGNNLSYNWDFDDGNSSTHPNPDHAFATYGNGSTNFLVTLTVTDENGCTDSHTETITINKGPEVSYYETNNFKVCLWNIGNISETAEIRNYSPDIANITSYTINWGDGSGTNPIPLPFDGSNPITHTYTALGVYPVTITATGNNGCVTTFTEDYVIQTNPVASIIGPTVGSNVGCTPLTVEVTNTSDNITSTTITTINWGDGSLPTILPPGTTNNTASHTYTEANCQDGNINPYTITLTASNACDNSSTTWAPIKVYEPPKASLSASKTNVCINDIINFTNESTDNQCASNPTTIYTWDFGDGNTEGPTPGLANTSHAYNAPGTYTVWLTAENNSTNGCGATDTSIQIYVSEVSADFSATEICFGEITDFTDQSTSNGSTINSWEWSFDDDGLPWWNQGENSSEEQNPHHEYTHPGEFEVELTVSDQNGCSQTITKTVIVDSLPNAGFYWEPFCFGQLTQFFDTTNTPDGIATNWQWNFGDGSTSSVQNPTHTYNATGTYTVLLTVTDDNGCSDSFSKNITVTPNPTADFTTTTACLNQPTQFSDNSNTNGLDIISWAWDFGDGSTENTENPQHIYNSAGNYTVSYTITDENGCTATKTQTIQINNLPTANFSNTNGCFGETTSFTDASASNIQSWNWNFGNGNTSTNQNPDFTFPNQGSQSVTLIVTDNNGCIDSISKTINIDSVPLVDFSYNAFCYGKTTDFVNNTQPTAGNTIDSYSWSFGDGNNSSQTNPSHTYLATGNYDVTLTATDNNGCIGSLTQTITVNPLPVADFDGNTGCAGSGTSFIDNSNSQNGNIISWNWDFGDGNSSNTQNPNHNYGTTGNFDVTLIITDENGCTDTITKNINSSFTITANFNVDTACLGNETFFSDASISTGGNIESWEWQFNDPNVSWFTPWKNTANTENTSHEYTQPGIYTVDLLIEDASGCTADTSIQITVLEGPDADFSFTDAAVGDPTNFTDNSNGNGNNINSWHWDFGDGNSSTEQNPQHTYGSAGEYIVTLTITDENGCESTVSYTVTIADMPLADFNVDNACFGSTVLFEDISTSPGGAITNWAWDFDDPASGVLNTSNIQNPTHNFTAPGNYTVTLIITDAVGQKDTTQKTIDIYNKPTADFNSDTACLDSETCFTDNSIASAGIDEWEWQFNDPDAWLWSNSSSAQNPCHTYSTAGSYLVDLIITDNHGCIDTVTKNITIYNPPTADFDATDVLLGDPTIITDQSTNGDGTITTWHYDLDDGNTVNTQNPTHTYAYEGSYDITLTVTDDNGCISSVTNEAIVYLGPTADFSYTQNCEGESTIFIDESVGPTSISSWQWDFGDGNTSTSQNPNHSYQNTGNYNVSLIITDDNNETDTIIKNIEVFPNPIVDFSWDSICENDTLFFIDYTIAYGGGIALWEWDFDHGWPLSNTSSLQNPAHIYSNAGNFDVSLTVTDSAGCIATTTHTILVNPNPIADFMANDVILGDLMYFIDQSTNGNSPIQAWNYNFDDGSNSIAQNPTHDYSDAGTYNVELTVTDSFGCSNITIKPVHVLLGPISGFITDSICLNDTTYFTDTTLSLGGNLVSWSWNFGDPASGVLNTSTEQHPKHYFASTGNYNIQLIVIDENGITDTTVQTITIHSIPNVDFSVDTACYDSPNYFTDLSDSADIWLWDFSDGYFSSTQNPYHHFADSGSYQVTLTIMNAYGCSNSITKPAQISTIPIADFTYDTVCPQTPVSFQDLSVSNNGISEWFWSFGDGTNASEQNPIHTYQNGGTYNVQLIITSNNGCNAHITKQVFVNNAPTANFTNNNATVGSATNFTDQSTGNIVSWQWSFGDGNTSTEQNPTHTYSNDSVYTVTLITANNNSCKDTIQKQVVVYSNNTITAAFTVQPDCFGDSLYFTDQSYSPNSAIVSWQWNFGDGNTSTEQNPTYLYALPGNYTITLLVTNDNSENSQISQIITVYALPQANFSASNVQLGQTTQFTDLSNGSNSTIVTWQWSFDDGNTDNVQNPAHTYATAGQYSVQLIVTNAYGCSDTITKQVIVASNTEVTSAFSVNNGCFGEAINFQDQSSSPNGSIVSWQWNFGDGNTATIQNPNHIYTQTGSYSITLIVTDAIGNCDTAFQNITIYDMPNAGFDYTVMCNYPTIQFTDTTTINNGHISQWQWHFGDNTSAQTSSPTHSYADFNNYTVTLTVTSNHGCTDSIQKTISVASNPEAYFSSTPNCEGYPTFFTDSSVINQGVIDTWVWTLGDGTQSNLQNPQHTYASAGDYIVTLIVETEAGCKDTLQKDVSINFAPVAMFNTENVCQGDSVSFVDMSSIGYGNINTWLWDFGDGTQSQEQNPEHNYTFTGSFNAKLIAISNYGCMDTISQTVTVYPKPEINFTFNSACENNAIQFTNQSQISNGQISSYNWNFGDNSQSTIQHPQHTYYASGNYNVTLEAISHFGCSNSFTQQIQIYNAPETNFSFAQTCAGSQTIFSDSSIINNGSLAYWNWNFGDGNTSTLPSPNHTYTTEGVYLVKLKTTTLQGCKDSITMPVEIYATPIASFSASNFCFNDSVLFTNNSQISSGTIDSIYYTFGDNSSSTLENPYHFYNNVGNYTASLFAISNYGCKDSTSQSIQIYPIPTVDLGETTEACIGTIVELDAGNQGATYQWSTGESSQTINISSSGTFSVKVSYGTCQSEDSISLAFYPSPVVNLGADTMLCGSNKLILDADNPGAEYMWWNGEQSQQIEVTQGYKNVWVTVSKYNCSESDTITILDCNKNNIGIPNAFSPNNDGENDVLKIYGDNIISVQWLIFNRYGEKVFETNTVGDYWDGTFNGVECSLGVYTYYLKVHFSNGIYRELSGNITLMR